MRYILLAALLCISLTAAACNKKTSAGYNLSVGASSYSDNKKFADHIIFKIWEKMNYSTEIVEVSGSFDGCSKLDTTELITSVISQGACHHFIENSSEEYNDGVRAGIIAGVKYLHAWTLSPGINDYLDLDGKTIFVGNQRGISAYFLNNIFNVLGIKPAGYVYGPFSEANELLESGEVDAVFGCISKNSAALSDALKNHGAHIVLFTPVQIDMITDHVELLQKMTIPAGTYGPDYPDEIVTVGDYQVYCFSDELSEEEVYFFIKGYYDYISSANLSQSDIYYENSSLSDVENIVIPLHLGAYRYFTEKGANISQKAIPPEIVELNVKPEK